MKEIELLMKELNLGEDVISQTLIKIDFICTRKGISPKFSTGSNMRLFGNGDGNGDGNN
jgi:hypothetical protein